MEQGSIKLHTLKYIIAKNDMSQRKVSIMTGIPEGRLSHIITGRLYIKKEEIDILANLFKLKKEVLFKELYEK